MVWFRRLTDAAIVFTFLQILLGGVTRLTGSGLSCPDWPRCYGMLVPTPEGIAALGGSDYTYFQVMLEWTHRLMAGAIVGPLALVLVIVAWRLRRENAALFPIMAAALVLVLVQAGLGGLTVLDRNSPWSVAVHLSVALVFLGVLLLAAVRSRPRAASEAVPGPIRMLAASGALVALVTVASGAMMAKSGASLACTTWPACDGALLPDMSDPFIALHFGHRLLALVTVILVLGLALATRRLASGSTARAAAATAAWLVLLQVAIGAFVVWLYVPVWLGAVHLGFGVLVFSALATVFWTGIAERSAMQSEGMIHGSVSRA